MTVSWRTPDCFPEAFVDKMWAAYTDPPPARHEDCQVSYSLPGIFGGWHCPCPCHKEKT